LSLTPADAKMQTVVKEIHIGGSRILYSTVDYPDAQAAMTGLHPKSSEWKRSTLIRHE
jgi:hypothetical protein